jgi:hypothetical protein
MATKMKASGNQRSAYAVKPIAIRTSTPSCFAGRSDGATAWVVAMGQFLLSFIVPPQSAAGFAFQAHGKIE